MEQEQIDMIKSYYDKQGEYKINHRYSGEQGAVYTRAGDNAHWLVIERKGEDGAEVRLTDDAGRITARDTYKAVGNTVRCTKVQRKEAKSRKMVEFDPDEINLIYQYGAKGRQGVTDALKTADPGADAGYTKKTILNVINKLSALSEDSCSELISSVRSRKPPEHDGSIKKRLEDAKKRQRELNTLKGNKSRNAEDFVL